MAQSNKKLWYYQPAEYFEESLVLGNGKAGASVFGGVESDKIYLNDATLWSGEPVDPYMNPEAYKHIPEIREALANEDYELADELNRNIQGKFTESFAPLGTLFLNVEHQGEVSDYYRELDAASKKGQPKIAWCTSVGPAELLRALRRAEPGQELRLDIMRERRSQTLDATMPENRLGQR